MRVLLAGLVLLPVGCGTSLPPTHPVTGTVVDGRGRPFPGGLVQFTSTTDLTLTVTGVIGPDGSFELKTAQGRGQASGAPVGEYRVTIIPPIKPDQTGGPPIELPGTCKIVAGDNRLDLREGKAAQPAS